MPLSEHEKQVLDEIEKSLSREDPSFAREVRKRSPHFRERRQARLGVLVFVAGFALLISFFVSGFVLVGIAAFGAMVTGIVLVAGAARDLARSTSSQEVKNRYSRRARDRMQSWEQRVRQRYKRD